MDLKKVQKEVSNVFKEWLDVDFRMEYGCLRGDIDFVIEGCNDEVHGLMLFFKETNTAWFNFFFDNIEKNAHTLDLINAYNADGNLLTACIDEDQVDGSCLMLCYKCLIPNENLAGEYTSFVMDALLSDDSLIGLTDITAHAH